MDLQAWATKGKEKLLRFGWKEWGMVLIAGVCCLIIVWPGGKGEETPEENQTRGYELLQETESEQDYVSSLEQRLEELLTCVAGVGDVRVMITVGSTTEKQVLQDGSKETEQSTEQDSAGGSRMSVSERSEGITVFSDTEGESSPYILSETYPEITGVVVIAEGSGKGTVDFDIMNAVQVLFDVPAHKIKIMKMK